MEEKKESQDGKSLWDAVVRARLDIAELKGMLAMHFRDGEHHHPPCVPASNLQKTILTAAGASILALVSALASIMVNFFKH